MAVQLEHRFTMSKPIDESFATITDLEQVVPCVEGGHVLERTSEDAVKAEIVVRMGAMSLTFNGTVEITEKDAEAHRAVMAVKSREKGGQGEEDQTRGIAAAPVVAAHHEERQPRQHGREWIQHQVLPPPGRRRPRR